MRKAKKRRLRDHFGSITDVRRGYVQEAQRGAVLLSVLGGGSLKDIPASMSRLRKIWHKRILSLKSAKWKPVQNLLNLQYVSSCPPFGVFTKEIARRCNRPLLCPFCWARRFVVKAYRHMNGLFVCSRSVPDLSLVEFRTTRHLHAINNMPWSQDVLTDAVILIRAGISADRCAERDHYDAVGGFVLHQVRPIEEGLLFSRAGLLLARRPKPREALDENLGVHTSRVHSKASRGIVAAALSRVCAYPAEMLSAPPKTVISILDGLYGARMLSCFSREPVVYRKALNYVHADDR